MSEYIEYIYKYTYTQNINEILMLILRNNAEIN